MRGLQTAVSDLKSFYAIHSVFDCRLISKGKVDSVLNLIKHYAMKLYGGVDI
jgi:hypothetical protein